MKLVHRVGHRGACLLFFALLDLVYGLSLVEPDQTVTANPLFAYLARIMPLSAWGLIWVAVAAVLLVEAFLIGDNVGFVLAEVLKLVWGILNLAAWANGGVPRGYVGAVIWIALAGFVLVLSGWDEPSRRGGDDGGAR